MGMMQDIAKETSGQLLYCWRYLTAEPEIKKCLNILFQFLYKQPGYTYTIRKSVKKAIIMRKKEVVDFLRNGNQPLQVVLFFVMNAALDEYYRLEREFGVFRMGIGDYIACVNNAIKEMESNGFWTHEEAITQMKCFEEERRELSQYRINCPFPYKK